MPAKLFPVAKRRLIEIWEYTAEKWGEEQADRYLRDLTQAIEDASMEHHRWRVLPDAQLPGVCFVRYGQHYIFFRLLSNETLSVITILHGGMHIPVRLKEDTEDAAL